MNDKLNVFGIRNNCRAKKISWYIFNKILLAMTNLRKDFLWKLKNNAVI